LKSKDINMLDIHYIINNKEEVQTNLTNRKVKLSLDDFLIVHQERVELLKKTESLRQLINQLSSKIKSRNEVDKSSIVESSKLAKIQLKDRETELGIIQQKFSEMLKKIPNKTHPESPIGKDDNENLEIFRYKQPTSFTFKPKDHVQLGKELDLIDFENATKISGAKFYFLKNEAVQLELGLMNFAVDTLLKEGFTLISTPDLAKLEILEGTGFNPRGEETQVYSVENTDLCLIGTSEITLGGMLSNTTLNESDLPIKLLGISHCFRTEAGAYGKTSKGLYRVHQFTKIEMFIFTTPELSDSTHEYLLDLEKSLFRALDIPFRVVDICTGDLGGPAYRKYDLEAWMPGRPNEDDSITGNWGEVTSTSNCTDYQSRRLGIKYKNKDGKINFVHMLNGTAFAIPRVILSIIENNQQEDGSVVIPKVLEKYIGKSMIQRKKVKI